MAETQQKRPREPEEQQKEEEPLMEMITKRHKNSYNQILSILDENTEEDDEQLQETTQDLTDFFTALQQELSSGDHPSPELAGKPVHTVKQETGDGDGDGDKEGVIRHLLEASDDELGIPNRVVDGAGDGVGGEDNILAGEEGGFPPVGLCDGLWDLEDEAANYYTLFHSQLIM